MGGVSRACRVLLRLAESLAARQGPRPRCARSTARVPPSTRSARSCFHAIFGLEHFAKSFGQWLVVSVGAQSQRRSCRTTAAARLATDLAPISDPRDLQFTITAVPSSPTRRAGSRIRHGQGAHADRWAARSTAAVGAALPTTCFAPRVTRLRTLSGNRSGYWPHAMHDHPGTRISPMARLTLGEVVLSRIVGTVAGWSRKGTRRSQSRS